MEDLLWCIDYLKKVNGIADNPSMPAEDLFRALQNITMPDGLSDEFYKRQDKVLQSILKRKKIEDVYAFSMLPAMSENTFPRTKPRSKAKEKTLETMLTLSFSAEYCFHLRYVCSS